MAFKLKRKVMKGEEFSLMPPPDDAWVICKQLVDEHTGLVVGQTLVWAVGEEVMRRSVVDLIDHVFPEDETPDPHHPKDQV